jgi:lipoic acid synthetase
MLLGDTCTRSCRFCAVATGNPQGKVDRDEPAKTAEAVAALDLDYLVITTVDRDDLPDGGASHLAETVRQIRAASPRTRLEFLVGDFRGRRASLETLLASVPDVFAHNLETVKRLTPTVRDRRASYRQSLDVLRLSREIAPRIPTKSSLMLGLGEADEEIRTTMRDLREAGVDFLTLGQYLRPTPRHLEVERFVTPAEFEAWRVEAEGLGFRHVSAGPLVRSSYKAAELSIQGLLP